jgi:hypothetical protein
MILYFIVPSLYMLANIMFGEIHEKTNDNIFWYMNKHNNIIIVVLKILSIMFFLPILVIVWKLKEID